MCNGGAIERDPLWMWRGRAAARGSWHDVRCQTTNITMDSTLTINIPIN